MSKRILSVVMSLIVSASIVGCSNKENSSSSSSSSSTKKSAVLESTNSEDEKLEGEWAKKYSLKKFKDLYEEKLAKVKEVTKNVGIECEEDDEKVKNQDDVFIAENSISFDNEGAKENKIQNFYFGEKLYGDDSSAGVIELKIVLKFDGEGAIKDNEFDLGNTTIAKYVEAFSGQENRDYSSINKEILSKLKAGEKEITITDTLDGLKEEIIADDKTIFYKLSTKKYNFTEADDTLEENMEAEEKSKETAKTDN